jgi:hypothetical protein
LETWYLEAGSTREDVPKDGPKERPKEMFAQMFHGLARFEDQFPKCIQARNERQKQQGLYKKRRNNYIKSLKLAPSTDESPAPGPAHATQ